MLSLKKTAVLYLFIALLAPAVCQAGISVSPSNQEVILKREEVFKDFFTVYNEGDEPIMLSNSLRDWFILPENKDKGMTSQSFLTIYPTYFYLPPKGQGDLFYEVKVPSYAVGSSVSMLSFTAGTPAAGVSMRVSVSISASVEKTEKISWEISDLKLNFGAEANQVTAALKMLNSGNVYVRPVGSLVLTGDDKKECTFNFEEEKPVYPGVDRTLFAVGQGCELKPGVYKAKVTLESWQGYKPWHQSKQKKFKIKINEDRTVEMLK